MSDGRFQGSDKPDFKAPVDLYHIEDAPKDGQWTETTALETSQPFRYVRYLSPDDGWSDVAEIEFFTSP